MQMHLNFKWREEWYYTL